MSKHHEALSEAKYRPDIDGLRAIAVLSVVAFHAFPSNIKGGFIGVDIFFVISGFLITRIILENIKEDNFSFFDFYSRRIKRIFPSLIIVLASTLFFGWLTLYPDELKQLGEHVFFGTIFTSNFILWNEVGYFDNAAETKPLLHLWSLGIEEQFYIAWPLLLFFAWKKKINFPSFIIFFLLVSFSLNIIETRNDLTAAFYSPQTRAWELLFGSLLAAIIIKKEKFKFLNKLNASWSMNFTSFSGVLLLFLGIFLINKNSIFPGYIALLPVCGTLLIILSGPDALINKYILSNKILVWFGLISFPLYLWHWPIISYLHILKDAPPSKDANWIAIIISILLAWLTFKFIEKPFRFKKTHKKTKFAILISLMIFISLAGIYSSTNDFSNSNESENPIIKRRGFEHAIERSTKWYQGKEGWLFLGNAYEETVAKLKGAIQPTLEDLNNISSDFSRVSDLAQQEGIKTFLMIAPNKSSIYPEFLPDGLKPSLVRYIDYFTNDLSAIKNLHVLDTTSALISSKSKGLLYFKSDSHWNFKGSYIAYSELLEKLELPILEVDFIPGSTYKGDIIDISKIKNYRIEDGDNFNIKFKKNPELFTETIQDNVKTSFGDKMIVKNKNPLVDKTIWVLGDSFTGNLKPYLNATFKEVYYIGNWVNMYDKINKEILNSDKKPDILLIVRVERSF